MFQYVSDITVIDNKLTVRILTDQTQAHLPISTLWTGFIVLVVVVVAIAITLFLPFITHAFFLLVPMQQ